MPLDLCRIGKGVQLKKGDEGTRPILKSTKTSSLSAPKKVAKTKTFAKANNLKLSFVYSDSNYHRMGNGVISGGERISMIKENLQFQLDDHFEKITIDVKNEQGGYAKFDVLINDEMWHDSERDGIPGPSALDQMYSIVKQILL